MFNPRPILHHISFRRPYAASVVIMATATVGLLMALHPDVQIQKVAFNLASILIAGFGTKCAIAISGGALKVALLMVASVLTMFVIAALFVNAEVFKAFVLENTAQVVGGVIIVVVDELLTRQVSDGREDSGR